MLLFQGREGRTFPALNSVLFYEKQKQILGFIEI
mgnify:FL=1